MAPKQPPLPILSFIKQESPAFFITDINAAIVMQLKEYLSSEGGPYPKRALILGDAMSGKTALLTLLANTYRAFPDDSVRFPGIYRYQASKHAFYDISLPLQPDEEVALFHALNTDAEAGAVTCLAMRPDIYNTLRLPDLTSRLKAMQLWHIPPPDEEMLAYLLGKALSERQLEIAPGLPEYAAARLPRRYSAAFVCAQRLDNAALERHCSVSVKLAAQCPEIFDD